MPLPLPSWIALQLLYLCLASCGVFPTELGSRSRGSCKVPTGTLDFSLPGLLHGRNMWLASGVRATGAWRDGDWKGDARRCQPASGEKLTSWLSLERRRIVPPDLMLKLGLGILHDCLPIYSSPNRARILDFVLEERPCTDGGP